MKSRLVCSFCGGKRFWKVRRNHLKCRSCRKEVSRQYGGLKISYHEWQAIIQWFVLEQSVDKIQE